MKIVWNEVKDLVPVHGGPALLPGYINGSPANDLCVIQEVRTALGYAWDQANEALYGNDDFAPACELLKAVLKDLFKITVRIGGDTRAVAKSLEDLLEILEDQGFRKQAPRTRRKRLIRAINTAKSKFNALEMRTVEPSPIKRTFKRFFRGSIRLEVSAEDQERARTIARVLLRGMSDEVARRINVNEDVRKAMGAFGVNVWSTVDEYRSRRAEILKRVHPDHGGDAEEFRKYMELAKVLDRHFSAD